jgi:hypothetical protein
MANASDFYLSAIAADSTGYRSKKDNIPFYIPDDGSVKVKTLFDKFEDVADFESQLERIKNRCTNRILLHYFPDFYIFYRSDIRDLEVQYTNAGRQLEAYYQVRQAIKAALNVVYYRPHDLILRRTKDVVLASMRPLLDLRLNAEEVAALKAYVTSEDVNYNKVMRLEDPIGSETIFYSASSPKELSGVLEALDLLPDVNTSLELFNEDEGISIIGGSTVLQIANLMEDNATATEGMSMFQTQLLGFEGTLPINLDFNSAQSTVLKVLNMVVVQGLMKDLTDVQNTAPGENLTVGGPFLDFSQADTLTLSFGKRANGNKAIAGITYVVNHISQTTRHLKTGYLTNVLYNPQMNDPLVLSTLKNYDALIRGMRDFANYDAPNFSFMEFMKSSGPGEFGMPSNFVWDDLPPPPPPVKNPILREAVQQGIIDLGETEALEKGFVLALTPEEAREWKTKIRENPEVYRKLRMAAKARSVNTAVEVTKVITQILNGQIPGLKGNSKLGILLRNIGIDELAKEAMICATFGLAPAFGRISGAVGNAISTVGSQIYEPPSPPSAGGGLTVPKPPELDFAPFTLDGKLWDKVLKVMLDTLMEGVLEIVKALADILKELCKLNNPRAEDYGDTNMSDLVQDNLTSGAQDLPNISNKSALDQMLDNSAAGLTQQQMWLYLQDGSKILSSMEICFLFTNQVEVTDETIVKILEFNLAYSDSTIRDSLNTRSAILGFFYNLNRFVDLTDFCNKIATELFRANVDNICLLEEAIPDRLTDLLEKVAEGLELDHPGDRINLTCPLRDDYISNPLVSDEIPAMFDQLVSVIEQDFVLGIDAAQQILKEPRVTTDPETQKMRKMLEETGVLQQSPESEGLSNVQRAILGTVKDTFTGIGDVLDDLDEHCDLADILGVEAGVAQDIFETVVDVLKELLNNPEFQDAISEIETRISDLSTATTGPGGSTSVSTTYVFPQSFKDKFDAFLWPRPKFQTERRRWIKQVVSNNFTSVQYPSSRSGRYEPITLKFEFPMPVTTQWIADPAGAVLGPRAIPRYLLQSTTQSGDSLNITFPKKSTIVSSDTMKLADVTLKSSLLPAEPASTHLDVPGPVNEPSNNRDCNPCVAMFSEALLREQEPRTIDNRMKRLFDTVLFPSAYAGQVEATFNFISQNGIFNTERLDSLNFFYDNTNCLPENVADLLDVDMILADLQKEMLDSLCYDDDAGPNPMGSKIRDVIRYGMFLLLIQIHVAQFIIKNIFVFAAFEIDEILELPTVKAFMATTIRDETIRIVQSYPMVRTKMVEFFNKKIKRRTVVAAGGITNVLGEVVFPAGTVFDGTDFDAIVEFLAGERILRSRGTVSNAVKRSSDLTNPKSFDRAFVEDVLTVQPAWFNGWALGADGAASENRPITVKHSDGSLGTYRSPWGELIYRGGNPRGRSAKARVQAHSDAVARNLGAQTLSYGKLVLERRVVWDAVRNRSSRMPTPRIIDNTTGKQAGLELNLFANVIYNPYWRKSINYTELFPELEFTNLRVKYDIVYYAPESMTSARGEEDEIISFNGRGIRRHAYKHQSLTLDSHRTLRRFVLATLDGELPLAGHIHTNHRVGDQIALQSQLEQYMGPSSRVTDSELDLIVGDGVFKDYFDKTFDRTLTTLVPIMYNFYLTTKTFPKMEDILRGPKFRCIEIFMDATLSENAIVKEPRQSPQAEAAALRGPAQDLDLGDFKTSIMDFILKMLIETPIEILKGVAKTMDPHVGISEIIRQVSAFAFQIAAQFLDQAPPIVLIREGGPPSTPPDGEPGSGPPMPPPLAPGLSGENVLKLLFCLLAVVTKAANSGFILGTGNRSQDDALRLPAPDSDNFLGTGPLGVGGAMVIGNPMWNHDANRLAGPFETGDHIRLRYSEGQNDPRDLRNKIPEELKDKVLPKITIKGVDFTGTLLGILMAPPGPFGIIYLLLMLLGKELEDLLDEEGTEAGANTTDVSEEESASEC